MRILTPRSFVLLLCLFAFRAAADIVYSNGFDGPVGTRYPEWRSSAIGYTNQLSPPGSGTLPAPAVVNTISLNGAQKFLGEFGGPPIGVPNDPGWSKTRVDQTITLSLTNLSAHRSLRLVFDLYILKSWDGNSPAYGPDRFSLYVTGGARLLDTTFSNNPKTNSDGSYQNYPVTNSLPRSGATSTNTMGYNPFFYDATYHFQFDFPHRGKDASINFHSSLFEGKGTTDESWGLGNISVATIPNSQ